MIVTASVPNYGNVCLDHHCEECELSHEFEPLMMVNVRSCDRVLGGAGEAGEVMRKECV